MESVTNELKKIGLNNKQIKRYTRRINRRGWHFSQDVKGVKIETLGACNYVVFYSNHEDGEAWAYLLY